MARIDAKELGRQAYRSDREAMRGRPKLLAAKVRKQLSSPFAFLRGQAATFYTMLAEAPELEPGPEGTWTLVGDAHLENFGAYRVDRAHRARPPKGTGGTREVAFDVNDIDDAWTGPFRYDVVRLATSFLLASRTHGLTGSATAEAAGVTAIMTRPMERAVYPRPYVASLIAAAGTLANLIPPSIALLVYGIVAKASSASSPPPTTRCASTSRPQPRGSRRTSRAGWCSVPSSTARPPSVRASGCRRRVPGLAC